MDERTLSGEGEAYSVSDEFVFPALNRAIEMATPLLLASIGGMISEVAGILNIALEGLILMGAFSTVLFSWYTGSLLAGVVLGIVATSLISLFLGFVVLYLKTNLFISGIAINLIAVGLISILAHHLLNNQGIIPLPSTASFPPIRFSAIEGVPIVGEILSGHRLLTYLSWALLLLTVVLLHATPLGLRLKGVGHNPKALISLGLHPRRYQLFALGVSGFACTLAGVSLVTSVGAYVPNISAGRGWIALVIVFLGNRATLGVLGASLLFALSEAFSHWMQGVLLIPADYIMAIPYVVAIIMLVITSAIRNRNIRQSR